MEELIRFHDLWSPNPFFFWFITPVWDHSHPILSDSLSVQDLFWDRHHPDLEWIYVRVFYPVVLICSPPPLSPSLNPVDTIRGTYQSIRISVAYLHPIGWWISPYTSVSYTQHVTRHIYTQIRMQNRWKCYWITGCLISLSGDCDQSNSFESPPKKNE